ncbi:hypothetical protein B484DRAFT_451111 [Ochromonadaceae sp. CCMP2298]|nr:hypothetical protein B484DRAFT_451111 [Ochromonadaceae sp. CCMP2298]
MSEAGKRMGFQLKGTSKRQRIVEEKKEEVDMITAIEGKEINSSLAKKTELLVIPLVAPVSSAPAPAPACVAGKTGRAAGSASEGVGLDQQAANELIAELTGRDCDASIQLVIAQPAHKQEASEEGGDGGNGGTGGTGTGGNGDNKGPVPKKAPLLMLHAAPELLNIANETERFKYDVSVRAADVSVRSDVYEAVPVSQFGAALLRGMGWAGDVGAEGAGTGGGGGRGGLGLGGGREQLVPRENRLGLGAMAKPPDRPKNKGTGARPPAAGGVADAVAQRKETQRKEWERRAEKRLGAQKLEDGDVVLLRKCRELALEGKRAVVVQARGVPGLDQIRVQMERSGRVLDTGLRDCLLVGPDDLEHRPFEPAAEAEALAAAARGEQVFSGMRYHEEQKEKQKQGQGQAQGQGQGQGEEKQGERREGERREGERGDGGRGGSSRPAEIHEARGSGGGGGGGGYDKPLPPRVYWLRENIRVKVVSKTLSDGRAYLQKGQILDVYKLGECSVRLDGGAVLEGVRERHLETVLPKVGGSCMVLLGEYRGQGATLLEKGEGVTVQLQDDLDVVVLEMDAIAATA